ncbi:hypothetical protein B0H10DRAFT_1960170 [Mycena sp. CBHHK59/15]|nr:hypothetical protein B0H10DRAFT_1960170 [Mycena sp. CBHHK59/15]
MSFRGFGSGWTWDLKSLICQNGRLGFKINRVAANEIPHATTWDMGPNSFFSLLNIFPSGGGLGCAERLTYVLYPFKHYSKAFGVALQPEVSSFRLSSEHLTFKYKHLWELSKSETASMRSVWEKFKEPPKKKSAKKLKPTLKISAAHSSKLALL